MLNKTPSLKHFVYLVGLHIYYKMIHGPYSIKFVYLVGLHIYYKMIHGPYSIKLFEILITFLRKLIYKQIFMLLFVTTVAALLNLLLLNNVR